MSSLDKIHMPKVLLVTGARGFIGRQVAAQLAARGDYVHALDAMTYAAGPPLATALPYPDPHFHWIEKDLNDLDRLPDVDAIINLAAETHVDNSLMDPSVFLRSNVMGMFRLLELARMKRNYQIPLVIQVSTDEVYGDYEVGYATPDAALRPSSPYSASKAAADLLVQAWGHSYGVPYRIVRPTNCYGRYQYPEKLIPKSCRHLRLGWPIPLHGNGRQIRHWLAVEDAALGILTVLDRGEDGKVYHLGGNTEAPVFDVVREIIYAYHGGAVREGGWQRFTQYVEFNYSRAGIDSRYALDDSETRALGWEDQGKLWRDLPALVEHYKNAALL